MATHRRPPPDERRRSRSDGLTNKRSKRKHEDYQEVRQLAQTSVSGIYHDKRKSTGTQQRTKVLQRLSSILRRDI